MIRIIFVKMMPSIAPKGFVGVTQSRKGAKKQTVLCALAALREPSLDDFS